jgi:flagellar biogenesis protein FliO
MTTLALLPLVSLLSLDLPAEGPPDGPTIDAAVASHHDGRLRVAVTTSRPVDAADVHTKLRDRLFSVYVEGARVPSDRTMLGDGGIAVVARSRRTYAKLEVALSPGAACAGAPEIKPTPSGVEVTLGCRGVVAQSTAPDDPAIAVAPRAPAPAKAVPAAAQTVATPAPPAARTPPPAAPLPPAAKAGAGHAALVAPVSLGLLAIVGAFGWRRRRARPERHIRILETAVLGPKRALILAEIDGKSLVLGASEAGIALLSTTPGTAPAPDAEAAPAGPPADGADEPGLDQGGILARLFHRDRWPERDADDARTGNPEEDEAFSALLRESLEDDELRRRLSGDTSGRSS